MISPNTIAVGENSAPISKTNIRATAEHLRKSLDQHSDRDLLHLVIGQMLDTKAEIRILQATVNTLLIELCHRQPDNLTVTLNRMSAQRYQELLSQFRNESDAFGVRSRAEVPPA